MAKKKAKKMISVKGPAQKPTLPLRRIFTRNLCLTVISYAIQEGHIAAYNTLWPSFLRDPVAIPGKDTVQLPFHFSGGLGMPVKHVAISLALVGFLGIPLQIPGYSGVVKRLGLLKTWRIFLVGLPLAYFLIPYISVVPSTSSPPAARDGPLVWLMIFVAQALIIGCSTFVIPSQIVLTNKQVVGILGLLFLWLPRASGHGVAVVIRRDNLMLKLQ